jgi:hypothetical protein
MKNIVLILVLLLAFFSCKKNTDPVANISNPLFYIDGLMNSQKLLIEAGVDSFYLQTDYNLNSTDTIMEYISEFKKPCANCKESFKIIIRNYASGLSKPYVFDSVFNLTNYDYYLLNSNSYEGSFTSNASGSGAITHLWDFGDGTTATIANPTKIFSNNYNNIITYTSSFSGGCSSNIAKKIDFSVDSPILYYPKIIYYSDTIGKVLNFTLSDSFNIKKVNWHFGDGDSLSGMSVTHNYNNAGVYLVKALVTFFSGKQIEVNQNINYINKILCKANYTFNFVPIQNVNQFSTIIMEYTDKNGMVYSSKNAKQNSTSFFKLLPLNPYVLNDKNQATYSFNLTGNAVLSNGTQNINFIGFKSKIAFSHP